MWHSSALSEAVSLRMQASTNGAGDATIFLYEFQVGYGNQNQMVQEPNCTNLNQDHSFCCCSLSLE